MKVKTPKVRLGNIDVQDFNAVPAAPSFDTSFITQIRVKNTNWGPNEFDAATATFLYQGVAVGQIVIPKSKPGMRPTEKKSLLSSSNLGNELSSGMLTLSSKAKLTDKVELMLIMKKKKSATMDCTMKFDLSSKAIQGLKCK
ncbi:uncharacterized protein Pyn_19761 [Prunus yedoensis var. nudiflora]|uniref:Late embryogenesis abundant protein LEA-2 subgroup domain-containing protein n=1 Tax=Prunus yedoensis var. nudiflora TaxID=2094558 RepID=A0A314UGN4_PRUYE|nr:uncharacterized protein Pyn_19761 [Prunus yedoensis var. nudiflora]